MTGSSTGVAARLRMHREATYNTSPDATNFWNIPFTIANLGTIQKFVASGDEIARLDSPASASAWIRSA